jgi:hypothetical protein
MAGLGGQRRIIHPLAALRIWVGRETKSAGSEASWVVILRSKATKNLLLGSSFRKQQQILRYTQDDSEMT